MRLKSKIGDTASAEGAFAGLADSEEWRKTLAAPSVLPASGRTERQLAALTAATPVKPPAVAVTKSAVSEPKAEDYSRRSASKLALPVNVLLIAW